MKGILRMHNPRVCIAVLLILTVVLVFVAISGADTNRCGLHQVQATPRQRSAFNSDSARSLRLEFDQRYMCHDPILRLDLFGYENSSLYIDLYALHSGVIARNICGNILPGSAGDISIEIPISLKDHHAATGLMIRRGSGDVTLYGASLYQKYTPNVSEPKRPRPQYKSRRKGYSRKWVTLIARFKPKKVPQYEKHARNRKHTFGSRWWKRFKHWSGRNVYGCGMPRWLKLLLGHDTDASDETVDSDQDGLSDVEEKELGSDPSDSSDALQQLEDVRAKLVMYWPLVSSDPLVFENQAGSPEDLVDMKNAYNLLAPALYRIVEVTE